MVDRNQIVSKVSNKVKDRFSADGVASSPSGEVNNYIAMQVRGVVRSLENPYSSVIRGWDGRGYHLDLCWWEDEENPESIVNGLAGAILDYEVRKVLGLPY